MCRLFGFRSVINSQVHSSLIRAENALERQSVAHPDGWGVSYYQAGAPHVIKSSSSALNDQIFQKVSGVVSSQTVIAHIRQATQGENTILNTHPFQFGTWTFAHNGNIKNFENHLDVLLRAIPDHLRRFILGKTDSEVLFFYLLGHIEKEVSLDNFSCSLPHVSKAVSRALEQIISIIGPYSQIDQAGEQETYLTFILTNGPLMIAHQGGKHLHYSTYKKRCGDRDDCPSYSPECEAPTKSGKVNHLIFSSEPLSGENIWIPLRVGEMIGVDREMILEKFSSPQNH